MSETAPIKIDHFTDALCVWAYIAQVRVDELINKFGEKVRIDYHFIPIFGAVDLRITQRWQKSGSYRGFGQHVREVSEAFPHVEVHPELWFDDQPTTSGNAHLFLKAVQHLAAAGHISNDRNPAYNNRTQFEEIMWRTRLAFFKERKNIAQLSILREIAASLSLPQDLIEAELESGAAMAALCHDFELCREWSVGGSPTYVLNEGRQKLYGNVGYKIIAANVQEILHRPESQASWC